MKLLFDSVQAAREVAYIVRGQYDGCTGVMLPAYYDSVALRTAIELVGAEFCFDGDWMPIAPLTEPNEVIMRTDVAIAAQLDERLGAWCQVSPS